MDFEKEAKHIEEFRSFLQTAELTQQATCPRVYRSVPTESYCGLTHHDAQRCMLTGCSVMLVLLVVSQPVLFQAGAGHGAAARRLAHRLGEHPQGKDHLLGPVELSWRCADALLSTCVCGVHVVHQRSGGRADHGPQHVVAEHRHGAILPRRPARRYQDLHRAWLCLSLLLVSDSLAMLSPREPAGAGGRSSGLHRLYVSVPYPTTLYGATWVLTPHALRLYVSCTVGIVGRLPPKIFQVGESCRVHTSLHMRASVKADEDSAGCDCVAVSRACLSWWRASMSETSTSWRRASSEWGPRQDR